MKFDTEPMLRPEAPFSVLQPGATGWRIALPLVVAAVVAILAIYRSTAESVVAIWWRSETFAHGFLIVPICVALVWARRRQVATINPSADNLGFLLLAVAGLAWLAAAAGQMQVIQQFAMVSMIPAAVIAIAGRRVALALAFPLAFLFLGVPMGEALIPPLMDWTADFTVAALRLSGIPVFREGTFFTIPSGSWSVVEGCSGLRYLIASITVGALYSYVSYRKAWKRVLFVALSVIVPIIANGMRAYMIVMIAHLSDMKLALGVDHFIYGWVFFGIVMLLLFWVGNFWRDDLAPAAARPGIAADIRAGPLERRRLAGAAAAVVALAGVWPLFAANLDRMAADRGPISLAAPGPAEGWTLTEQPLTDWRPRYEGAAASLFQTYRKGNRVAALYLGFYRHQRHGAELVTSTNVMVVQKHPVWSNVGESRRAEDDGNGTLDVRQTRLRSTEQRLLVWDWFRISGSDLINPYLAKILLARDRLLDRGDDAAAVIIAVPYDERPDVAEATLRQFVREMKPSIDAALDRAAGNTGSAGR